MTAGHATTALYDVQLREGAEPRDPFVTATVRYRDPSGRVVERWEQLGDAACAPDLAAAAPRLHQDLVIAMLTDQLTRGPWSQWLSPEEVRAAAYRLPAALREDADVVELVGPRRPGHRLTTAARRPFPASSAGRASSGPEGSVSGCSAAA